MRPMMSVRGSLFFFSLREKFQECDFIVGDFNVKMTRLDVSESCVFRDDMSRSVLGNMMNECSMSDVWRERNTGGREFSRTQVVRGVLKQSRIDFCLSKNKWLDQRVK